MKNKVACFFLFFLLFFIVRDTNAVVDPGVDGIQAKANVNRDLVSYDESISKAAESTDPLICINNLRKAFDTANRLEVCKDRGDSIGPKGERNIYFPYVKNLEIIEPNSNKYYVRSIWSIVEKNLPSEKLVEWIQPLIKEFKTKIAQWQYKEDAKDVFDVHWFIGFLKSYRDNYDGQNMTLYEEFTEGFGPAVDELYSHVEGFAVKSAWYEFWK